MIESFLITSRETLEASLVVGIVLAYLHRSKNHEYKKTVYYGIFFGVFASIIMAYLFSIIAGGFTGKPEQVFEGATMLLGALLLTTMIFWMIRQKHAVHEIEEKLKLSLEKSEPIFSHYGIFMLICIAILREGVETVIFLNAANYAAGSSFIGGVLGVITAIVFGYIFFVGATKINLKSFFSISSIMLIFFAAGLVAHGVHELEEAGILDPIIEHVWDINPGAPLADKGIYPAFHEKGAIGSFMNGLFGYNGDPSLLEVFSYFCYLLFIFYLWKSGEPKQAKEAVYLI